MVFIVRVDSDRTVSHEFHADLSVLSHTVPPLTRMIHLTVVLNKRVRQDSLVESAFQDCGQLVQLASAVQRE